jgi:hypothetical protein
VIQLNTTRPLARSPRLSARELLAVVLDQNTRMRILPFTERMDQKKNFAHLIARQLLPDERAQQVFVHRWRLAVLGFFGNGELVLAGPRCGLFLARGRFTGRAWRASSLTFHRRSDSRVESRGREGIGRASDRICHRRLANFGLVYQKLDSEASGAAPPAQRRTVKVFGSAVAAARRPHGREWEAHVRFPQEESRRAAWILVRMICLRSIFRR